MYANAALATYPEFDSESIIATAGSKEKGRGGAYTDFHGSEVAFWPDAEKLVAGAMQGGRPEVILESTPNGAQGYFYDKCMEALDGDSIWTLHFYPWWWDDEYRIELKAGERLTFDDEELNLMREHGLVPEQINWRRYKKRELRRLFSQEYPEDPLTCFLTSGNSYFGDLSNVFIAPLDVAHDPEHEYFGGLDFGQTADYTALIVLDATVNQMVDILHINKLEWSEQRSRIKQMYDKWNLKALGAERNSIGSVNIEALHDAGMSVMPFDTTNETKADIMSNLYEAIHTSGLKLQPSPVLRQEMYNFVSSQLPSGIWRLAADEDGHDDTVIALAIALWAKMSSKMQIF